jgi:predicted nuclease of predicted toxin-antitoxin system
VRVLLDENLPGGLAGVLPGHDVATVHALGWSGLKNGELLRRAVGRIEAFITMDSNLEFQQRLVGVPFAVVVIHARSNRVADLLPLAEALLAALADVRPGTVRHVGA